MHYTLPKKIGLLLGPILFVLLYFMPGTMISPEADKVLAVTAWMVTWWITEATAISVTALIPLVFFPLFGIATIKTVASSYGDPIVFLFFGGFVMALALEKVNLHKRIALLIVQRTGTSPDRVILGFLLATAFLSMWISNTATTVVMLPIVTSVITLLAKDADGLTGNDRNFALCLTLGIAYAASAGGMATIIGTPPNSVAVGFMEKEYQRTISFVDWMIVGVPFSLLMLGSVYIVLVKWLFPNKLERLQVSGNIINEELAKLGAMKKTEKRVLLIFIITILLWIVRVNINEWLPGLELSDTGISMLAAFALFCVPFRFGTGEFIIGWDDTARLPWGILILFGGGLALASALSEAKVIEYIGDLVSRNKTFTTFTVATLLVIIVVFMTELISNVALVVIFAPVVAGIAQGLGMDIFHLLLPMTIAASCGFMMPMSTPPNAIVFASGHIKVQDMARAGFFLNLISIVLLLFFYSFVIPRVF